MPEKRNLSGNITSFIVQNSLAVGIVVVVLFLFIPLTKFLIDLCMVLNFALSFIILLSVIYVKRAADFTSFPRLTLLSTLFGLAINIASTKNILLNPVKSSTMMPGQSEIVQSFANIVAGNSVVVGFVVFIILIVVQVIVISKGSERVSEVVARFTLDAMNTKKFSLQNKLNQGAITQEEYDELEANLDSQIDFYSLMDGASKFVSGNVKAGIFITVINLIGGVVTGMMGGHLKGIGEAFSSYAKLTIGDGLTSQLPALVLSFSTGLLITGGNDGARLDEQLKSQFTRSGHIYIIVGLFLAGMGIAFHNASTFVLLLVGALFIVAGIRLSRSLKKEEELKEAQAQGQAQGGAQKTTSEEVSPIAELDELSLEIGYALIPLVDAEKGAELMSRVKRIRREAALDLGIVIPAIHIMDQMELSSDEYSFKIRGIEVGRSRLKQGHFMCLNTGGVPKDREIAGEATKDPAFNMDAIWLPDSKRLEAEKAGYAVIDPPTIIATHLTELIRKNAASILSRQSVSAMIEKVKEKNPVVVDEVLGGDSKFTYGEIETILKNLLSEQVSIRNMVTILESLGDNGKFTHDVWLLTEKVREALGAQICQQYVDENKTLHVVYLSQELSQNILAHTQNMQGKGPMVAFDPVDGRKFLNSVSSAIAQVRERGFLPIILCASEVRRAVKSATEREMPGIVVLSINEVMNGNVNVESLGEING